MFLKKDLKKFIIYCFFGGIAALVYLGLMYVFTSIIGIYYILSVIISQPFAILTNFFLNKYYNFRIHTQKTYTQLIKFTIVVVGGIGLNVLFVYILVEFFKIFYLLGAFISTLLVAIYSYLFHKYYSFRDR